MHIIFAIVSILFGIAIWYHRLKVIGGAAKDVGKVAQRVRNAPRKFAFERKARQTSLQGVTDSREAAVVLMVLVARAYADQPLEGAHRKAIETDITTKFGYSLQEAEDMITLALWRVQNVDYPSAATKRMTKVLINDRTLGLDALLDLEMMLTSLMKAAWKQDDHARDIIQIYRKQAGLIG